MKNLNFNFIRIVMLSILISTSAIFTGCGPTAYKITPIPISEELQETIVVKDKGIFLPKIALIDIDGMILNYRKSSLIGSSENPMALIIEKLDKADADPRVKAIVLRINSPGGTVTASDIIYRHILAIKKGDKAKHRPPKPVVVSMMDVCASGGYYIACSADKIFAEPTTVTGSIGVVMMTFNLKGLMDKIGVTTDAIKSGPKKDAGSPFRPLKPSERKIFQDMINQFYHRFVNVVCYSRKKSNKQVLQLADGRIYSGQDAFNLGLIDKIGSLEDAIDCAKKLAGIKSANVVMYHRPTGYRGSIYSSTQVRSSVSGSRAQSIISVELPNWFTSQGAFLYLWQP